MGYPGTLHCKCERFTRFDTPCNSAHIRRFSNVHRVPLFAAILDPQSAYQNYAQESRQNNSHITQVAAGKQRRYQAVYVLLGIVATSTLLHHVRRVSFDRLP